VPAMREHRALGGVTRPARRRIPTAGRSPQGRAHGNRSRGHRQAGRRADRGETRRTLSSICDTRAAHIGARSAAGAADPCTRGDRAITSAVQCTAVGRPVHARRPGRRRPPAGERGCPEGSSRGRSSTQPRTVATERAQYGHPTVPAFDLTSATASSRHGVKGAPPTKAGPASMPGVTVTEGAQPRGTVGVSGRSSTGAGRPRFRCAVDGDPSPGLDPEAPGKGRILARRKPEPKIRARGPRPHRVRRSGASLVLGGAAVGSPGRGCRGGIFRPGVAGVAAPEFRADLRVTVRPERGQVARYRHRAPRG